MSISEVEQIIGRPVDEGDYPPAGNPPTLDLDQPVPSDMGAAVCVLWEIAKRQRDELATLQAQLDGRGTT